MRALKGTRGTLTLSMTVSKGASGLAPLAVWFDASASTSTVRSNPYHEIRYLWDFGDSGAPSWTVGGRKLSENVDEGPVARHVYRSAGTFTPTLMAFDGVSASVLIGSAITTTSPTAPSAWAGGNTILCSTSSTFTCAGVSGATTTTSWDAAVTALNSIMASNGTGAGRILLRKSDANFDAITLAAGITSPGGPIWIGTYDDTGPLIGTPGTTNATIKATAGGTAGHGTGLVYLGNGPLVGHNGMNDVRFTNIAFDTSLVAWPTHSFSVTLYGQWKDVLFMDCPLIGANYTGIDISSGTWITNSNFKARGYTIPTNVAFHGMPQSGQNLTDDGPLNTWGYIIGKQMSVMGCTADAKQGTAASTVLSHCLRVLNHEKLVIAHNDFKNGGSTRHAIKLHSMGVQYWDLYGASSTVSSTSNSGNGDFIRPNTPVTKGFQTSDQAPQIWRCTTGGTMGSVEPTWNTGAGSTTSEAGHGGTAVWTECTAAFYGGTKLPLDDLQLRDTTFGTEQYYSSQSVVRDNKFGPTTSGWVISAGSQDDVTFEVVYDSIIESNFLTGCASNVAAFVEQTGTRRMTIRNNLLDMSGGSTITVVEAPTRGSGNCYVAHDTWFYENSIVCTSTASTNLYAMEVDAFNRNPVLRNNLFYNTSGKTANMLLGTAHASFPAVVDHNTPDVSTFATDPKFSGALSAVAGWQITDATSYTKNAGTTLPVWADFFGNTRPTGAAPDLGASEQ